MIRYKQTLILGAILAAMLWPADALAQRAVPRSHGGRTVVVAPRHYYRPYYRPYYYSPFYYPWYGYAGFYNPYYFGFGFGYGYGYGYGPYAPYYYPPYYYGAWDNTGAARLEVTPRNAKVYVDGYFAGTVDDFDGTFQRLNVEAGEHDLQFFLEGYRPFSQKVLFVRGRTLKLSSQMQPLAPGDPIPEVPKPDPSREPNRRTQPSYRDRDQAPRPGPAPGSAERSSFGSLLLRVRPADATILVDGELWTAPENEDQFVIELAEGPHRIEVRKDGFQTYATTVRVRRGDTVRLNVGLTQGAVHSGF